ncbi:alpha/beta hydrolase fold domain-containing protein [Formosa sp. 3Alg 14/1]|uniref:alpha/beta hydrolase fold domain-containing protein n=1 Tax=Formosa sp. 3Alg 14/1 TaxID=3382190 RepID=UPI0039BE357B
MNLTRHATSLWFFSFLFLVSSLTVVYAQKASDYGFIKGTNFQEDVVYKTVDGKDLVMDVFFPDADKLKAENPWMVFVHGGGWAGGHMDNIYRTAFVGTLKKLVENGVVCVSIDYRLAKAPVTSLESAIDCKDAARFLLKHAEDFKLDKENYGVWGGSAGGHLSLVTALVPDDYFPGDKELAQIHPKYKCVVSYYPFTSCLNPDLRPNSVFADSTLFKRLLGGTLEEKPELARLLSPTEFLNSDSLPVLLVHGDSDKTLPIINSQYMVEVAKEKGADVELLTVVNGGHSFSGDISPSQEEIDEYTTQFILSHLK